MSATYVEAYTQTYDTHNHISTATDVHRGKITQTDTHTKKTQTEISMLIQAEMAPW